MSAIHPFDLYKMFISLRIHFTSLKFIYNYNKLNIKYENFYRTKNYIYYEKLSKKMSKENAEKLFISNFLKDTNTSIHIIPTSLAEENKNNWQYRLKNIDKIFQNDVKNILKEFNIKNIRELYYKLNDIEFEEVKNVISSVSEINTTPMTTKSFYSSIIYSCNPETILLLNEMYFLKYKFEFLKKCIEKKIEPKKEFLKIFKYNYFIDARTVMSNPTKFPNINNFYSNI